MTKSAELILLSMAEPGPKPSVRLYAILARKAPLAVVFRRGPTRQVLLVQWRTDADEFSEGQWLKGRIYERRCDLSPSAKRLIYFAANYKEPYFSWTAISKPPFLAAVALWPKGDGWGGGGLFLNEKEILLNHRENEMTLADGFTLPKFVSVAPLGTRLVVQEKPGKRFSLGRTDWADWCPSGDLLFSREGKIFRLGFDQRGELLPITEAKLLIDLSDKKFAAKQAPEEAKVWSST